MCLPRPTPIAITSGKQLLTEAMEVSVVQLQLLDLMIERRQARLPLDPRVEVELVDLMASILVAVFETQEGRVDESGVVQSKNHAGAPGAKSAGLLAAVQRKAGAAEQGESATTV
jgi:hypothetical protein